MAMQLIKKLAATFLTAVILVVAGPVSASHRDNSEPVPAEPCECSAKLSFSKPLLQYSSNTVTFTPRFDIYIKSKLPRSAPVIDSSWQANLQYEGQASYESDDLPVPAAMVFSEDKIVATGVCGGKYDFKGIALAPIQLTGLTRDLVGDDQKIMGTVALDAKLDGCDFSVEEQRQFSFDLKEFGNLKVRGWRSFRAE